MNSYLAQKTSACVHVHCTNWQKVSESNSEKLQFYVQFGFFFWKKVNRKYLLSLCAMFAGVCFIWTLWYTIELSVSFDLHVETALSDLKTMYELNSIRTQPVKKIIVVSCECFSSVLQPSSLASGTFQEKFKPTKREPLFIGFTAAFINIQFGFAQLGHWISSNVKFFQQIYIFMNLQPQIYEL